MLLIFDAFKKAIFTKPWDYFLTVPLQVVILMKVDPNAWSLKDVTEFDGPNYHRIKYTTGQPIKWSNLVNGSGPIHMIAFATDDKEELLLIGLGVSDINPNGSDIELPILNDLHIFHPSNIQIS